MSKRCVCAHPWTGHQTWCRFTPSLATRAAAPTSITLDAGHDFHDYGPLVCRVCGQPGQVFVSIEPQRTPTPDHEPWCYRRHTGDCVDGPSLADLDANVKEMP